jgi:hypothetical protein
MPLPFSKTISTSGDVGKALKALPARTRVGLGISAPKQNYLAVAMHAIRPDLEYHCLGAAIAEYTPGKEEGSRATRLSGSGFEWLRFLTIAPRRTLGKIVKTVGEAFAIRFHPSSHNDFKRFAGICMPVNEERAAQEKRRKI